MTKTHKTTTRQRLFRTLALLSMICLSLSSCSPWDSELEEIYQSAQKGDRLSQFAIVKEYKKFKDIVPQDTMDAYMWRFIKEGNNEALLRAITNEEAQFRNANPNKTEKDIYKEYDKIYIKWYNIGIKYNNSESCYDLAKHYKNQYKKNGNPLDSIKAAELYEKGIEMGNVSLCLRRDIKAGFGNILTGAIEQGVHSYKNIFKEQTFIIRLTRSLSYSYAYVVSAAVDQIFTAAWWKALLILLFMLLLSILPIALLLLLTHYSVDHLTKDFNKGKKMFTKSRFLQDSAVLGFANYICYAVAETNENLVWLDNINSLRFSIPSYGIQPYFPLAINWLTLIFICYTIYTTFKNETKDSNGIKYAAVCSVGKLIIFLTCYLTAQVGGTLFIVILALLFMLDFGVKLAKEAPTIIAEAIFSPISNKDTSGKASNTLKVSGCESCMHWNPATRDCEFNVLRPITTHETDFCDNWSHREY